MAYHLSVSRNQARDTILEQRFASLRNAFAAFQLAARLNVTDREVCILLIRLHANTETLSGTVLASKSTADNRVTIEPAFYSAK